MAKTSYPLPSPSSSPQKRVLDLVNTGLGKGKTLLKGRLKSNTMNEPPTNLQVTETKGSPLPIRRNLSDKNLSQLGTSPSGSSGSLPFEDAELKARCQSDASSIKVGLPVKNIIPILRSKSKLNFITNGAPLKFSDGSKHKVDYFTQVFFKIWFITYNV